VGLVLPLQGRDCLLCSLRLCPSVLETSEVRKVVEGRNLRHQLEQGREVAVLICCEKIDELRCDRPLRVGEGQARDDLRPLDTAADEALEVVLVPPDGSQSLGKRAERRMVNTFADDPGGLRHGAQLQQKVAGGETALIASLLSAQAEGALTASCSSPKQEARP
jgi:hypothetical protein